MIFTTNQGELFDTDSHFKAPERHILQKLFIRKDFASVEDFRGEKQKALHKACNNSGPISESSAMKSIMRDVEARVSLRLRLEKNEKR